MDKFITISGGGYGKPNKPYEIEDIDKEIVAFSGKKSPNFLFIGFANIENASSYFDILEKNFTKLGCLCKHLEMADIKDFNATKCKIEWADIIYVGGGNTLKLMIIFRKYGIDKLLEEARKSSKVLCGISAGAICWYSFGNSGSRLLTSGSSELIKVKGLDFLPAIFCPHYDENPLRKPSLKKMLRRENKRVGLGLDNCTAIQIYGDKFRIISTKQNASVYKCFWEKGKYIEKIIKNNEYLPIYEFF